MFGLVSVAAPRALPQADAYGVDELNLFQRFNRADFLSKFGRQAPAYDSSRRIKRWFDSAAALKPADEPYTYLTLGTDAAGAPLMVGATITCGEAAAVNLPGRVDWPAWAPARSGAFTVGPTGRNYLNAELLSTWDQATALQAELGAQSVQDGSDSWALFPVYYDPSETRRILNVVLGGRPFNVGQLLKQKYAAGVGAPGAWDLSQLDQGPIWKPGAVRDSGEWDTRPEVAMPMRQLYGCEQLATVFGGVVQVRRTDRGTFQRENFWLSAPQILSDIAADLRGVDAKIDQVLAKLAGDPK
jgi:hypothetical protein